MLSVTGITVLINIQFAVVAGGKVASEGINYAVTRAVLHRYSSVRQVFREYRRCWCTEGVWAKVKMPEYSSAEHKVRKSSAMAD
jgi:hypothetical protein